MEIKRTDEESPIGGQGEFVSNKVLYRSKPLLFDTPLRADHQGTPLIDLKK